MNTYTLIELRNNIHKSASRYSNVLGIWTKAKLLLLDNAISENRVADVDGWVFLGDLTKEFDNIKGLPTKQGELHWINLSTEAPYHCVRYKIKFIKYQ